MCELARNLISVIEEHEHESGLHMIGGRRKLIDRLVQFFEEQEKKQSKSASKQEH